MIVVKRADGVKKEVSVGNLSSIIVNSRGVSITSDAMMLLLGHGIQVVFISRNRPVGKLQPMRISFPVALRKEQIKAQLDERGMRLAKTIVVNKIENQIKLLKRILKSRLRSEYKRELHQVLEENIVTIVKVREKVSVAPLEKVDPSWLISKEAEAAKYYWSSIAAILPEEVGFRERKTKYEKPTDPFNLSLNYLYSILAAEVWFSVELAGLDPYIGYLHEDNNRRPSLVMDLMEEFRQPIVDKLLLKYFARFAQKRENLLDESGRLHENFRKQLLKLFFEELNRVTTFMNRSLPIKGHLRLQPNRLAKYILGISSSYQPFNVI